MIVDAIFLLIVNVALTLLPAMSVTINVYVPLSIIVVPSVKSNPFNVAVAPELLSPNVMVMSVLYVLPLVAPEKVGGILSIRDTVSMRESSVRVFVGEKPAHVVYGPVPRR